jgi:hypothetical protein
VGVVVGFERNPFLPQPEGEEVVDLAPKKH